MLLASAPRDIRARWLGVSTLVLALALAVPADAQDGTVYIGGGSNSQDEPRGVQGGDNVIVNMDAIDGGRGRGTWSGGGRDRGADGGQGTVNFGEPYRGPAGAILRFPPERPPQSQLVVDPNDLPDERQASRGAQQGDPTPARKPERRRAQTPQRTAETTPERKPDTGSTRSGSTARAARSDEPVAVPDTPSFDEPRASSEERRTARQSQTQTSEPAASDPAASDPAPSDASSPTDLTARPGRKPQPPADVRTAGRSQAQPTQTTTAAASDSAPTAANQTATSSGTASRDADTDTTARADTTSEPAGPTDDTATASASQSTGSQATGSQAAGSQAAGSQTSSGQASSGQTSGDRSGDAGAEAAGETQTAALPPEGLPEQLRLRFDDGSATLSASAKGQLDQLAQVLEDNPRQRVQLMAFAQGTEDTASQARRLSLSRALAVRTYLIDRGIRSTRMDVRALGATADQGPLDRVDIVPASR